VYFVLDYKKAISGLCKLDAELYAVVSNKESMLNVYSVESNQCIQSLSTGMYNGIHNFSNSRIICTGIISHIFQLNTGSVDKVILYDEKKLDHKLQLDRVAQLSEKEVVAG
jgi:hypothetical protein